MNIIYKLLSNLVSCKFNLPSMLPILGLIQDF